MLLPSTLKSQEYEEEDELFRPKYSPRSEKHRNKMDALGRKQGLWRYYTREGVLFLEISFQNDIKHGPCIRHHSATGIITEESNYFNGRRDGEYRRFSVNGTITTEGNYTMGKKTGKWITYYMVNAEKKTEGYYKNGKRDGEWKYYNSKGKLKIVGPYKDGVRDGEWVFYNPDGSVMEQQKYVGGVSPEESQKDKDANKKNNGFFGNKYKKPDKNTPPKNKKPE